MNIQHIRFVLAVAKAGSFSRAAEICCVTQPALSNAISQLEETLGAPLFVRTTRKVENSEFGNQLLPYFQSVLDAHAALITKTASLTETSAQTIKIGLSPLVNIELVNQIISTFRSLYPECQFVLQESNMQSLASMIDTEKVDIAFSLTGLGDNVYERVRLYQEPLLYLPSKSSALISGNNESIELEDIASELFVMVEQSCGLASATHGLFQKANIVLNEYPGQALRYSVLEDWANLGLGSALLPASKVVSTENVQQVNWPKGKTYQLKYEAVWLPFHQQRFSLLKKFVEYLIKQSYSL